MEIRVGSLKNDSLMGKFMIMQPLSTVEVSYQDIEMVSTVLDQNIPLMEEYGLVTWLILDVRSPSSLYLLHKFLSSDETIIEIIKI